MEEYKTTNQQLSQEINALGGDSTSLGHGQSREVLLAEIEKDRLEKLNIEKGLPVLCCVQVLKFNNIPLQLSKM